MEYLKEMEVNEAVREVFKRSVIDVEFRELALRDGNAAIALAGGKPVAPSLKVTFVSNEGASVRSVVLPDPISEISLLTEEELEQIAGGTLACGVTSCGASS